LQKGEEELYIINMKIYVDKYKILMVGSILYERESKEERGWERCKSPSD
jgi:hypothetical protein